LRKMGHKEVFCHVGDDGMLQPSHFSYRFIDSF
jgi:hypothetical protein